MFSFRELLEQARESATHTLAESTEVLYRGLYDTYLVFFRNAIGAPDPEPVTTEKVLAFLNYKRQMGLCYGTIRSYLSAISHFAHKSGVKDISIEPEIMKFMTNTRKETNGDSHPFQVAQVTTACLSAMKMVMKENFIDKRDMAMMTVQFMTLMRISELINLNFDDFEISEEKIVFEIKRSKTDQNGKGRYAIVFKTLYSFDAYTMFKNYLNIVEIKEGPLWKASDFNNKQLLSKLTANAYRERIKKWYRRIDLEAENFSSHSLRRGGAYFLANKGISAGTIKTIGGWKSSCYLTYIETDIMDASEELKIKL